MTAPRVWPSTKKRVTCQKCGNHLTNIVPKDDGPIKAVIFQRCDKCYHYNVVDLEEMC